MGDLTGRRAIVTGGSRGIGEAIALRLAEDGADVAVCASRSLEHAEKVADANASKGRKSLALQADIAHPDDVKTLVDRVVADWEGLDILVNNAGVTADNLIMRMKEDEWDRVLDVNLKGTFLCTQAAVRPMMKARYGRIVNVSSVTGLMGNPGQANYTAAKSGLFGLTKTVAKELAARGITANVVAPGFIPTEMTEKLSGEVRKAILDQIPLGRLGSSEDIAAAVAFLASEEAGYITGQILAVDGGLVM